MATYYGRNTGGNWNSNSTWSTVSSSSSTNTGTFPGVADTAILDSGSGNITINVASTVLVFTCTGYTGTLAFNANLTMASNSTLTLGSGMTVTADVATRRLILGAGMTVTSNGVYLPVTVTCGGVTTSIYLFADDFECLHAGVSAAVNFNGNFRSSTSTTRRFKIRGDYYYNATVQSLSTNIIIFSMVGTGTYNNNGTLMAAPLEFNTSGTITINPSSHNISNSQGFSVPTLKYVSGTIITSGSTVFISNSTGAPNKIDTSGMTFDNVVISARQLELLSTLMATSITTGNQSVGNYTISGVAGFQTDYLYLNNYTALGGSYRQLNLTYGNTYVVNKLISTPSPPSSISSISSTDATNKVVLTLNGGSNLIRCNLTRVDASNGVHINTIGVITTCSNIGTSTQNILI